MQSRKNQDQDQKIRTKSNKQLTARDVEILGFINEMGFCEMPHIEKRFGIKGSRSYQVMNRLIQMDLIKHERVFYGRHGIFRATGKGASFTSLPPLEKVPIGIYEHQVTLIDVYLKLRALYPEAIFISERQLQHEKYCHGIGKPGHLADGILVMDDKKIAIEVELSMKGKHRIEQILKGYGSQFQFAEVWYFCLPNLLSNLTLLASHLPFIKINNIEDFLAT